MAEPTTSNCRRLGCVIALPKQVVDLEMIEFHSAEHHEALRLVSSGHAGIAVLLGLVARQRHQPGFGIRRDDRFFAWPWSVLDCRQRPISQRL
jgi:hypothetical protein